MQYRKSTSDDCIAIHRLISEMEQTDLPYQPFSKIYQRQLADERYYCLLCEDNEQIIGVLNLRFEEQLHHCALIAEILEFAVASSYRRQGIGKQMLAKAVELAQIFDCTQLEVACNQLRTDTHRFYEREGLHNFHFKFSRSFLNNASSKSMIGQ